MVPADFTEVEASESSATLRRRRHSSLFLLLFICGAVSWIFWRHNAPIAETRLPDGSTIQITTVSGDSAYSWPPERVDERLIGVWNRVTEKTPLPRLYSLSPTVSTGFNPRNSAGWIEVHADRSRELRADQDPAWLTVTDSNGWRTLLPLPGPQVSPPHDRILSLPGMPETSRLHVEVMNSNADVLGTMDLDWHRSERTNSVSRARRNRVVDLPHTETNGEVSVTLHEVSASELDRDEVPDEFRKANASGFSLSMRTNVMFQGQETSDWMIFDDLRRDDSLFFLKSRPWFISNPYSGLNISLICICRDVSLLASRDYARFAPSNKSAMFEKNPLSGVAPVKMIAWDAEGEDVVQELHTQVPVHLQEISESFETMVGRGASGMLRIIPVAEPDIAEQEGVRRKPARVYLELKSPRPKAVFLSEAAAGEASSVYCCLVHDADGNRIPGYQYNDNMTGLIFWFPRDSSGCPKSLNFTLIRQTIPEFQFLISPPADALSEASSGKR